jgi:Putative transposase/Transposase zinc-binding domain
MTRPRFEVADVIRDHGDAFLDAYGDTVSPEQRRVLTDLARCRTAALGGHVEACDRCGHRQASYNSCRNRHCPKCQANEAARWVEARAAELLPVEYFHVVFTLPAALGPIALQNPRVVYDLLFRAAADTLLRIAADPSHLGARIGFLAVLHTWGQTLQHHPHLHCVVPGGGLSPDGSRWVSCPGGFFLPVKVLSPVFRGKFLAGLRAAFDRGKFAFHGKLAALADPDEFQRRLSASARSDWVVYAKPPFGGPGQVLKYLARYTHRVAISNHRLLDLKDGRVTFQYKDYARGGQRRTMELTADEFLRRFLQHVLPAGFVRVRSYGFLANRNRQEKLAACRELLSAAPTAAVPPETPSPAVPLGPAAVVTEVRCATVCPVCGVGRMVVIGELLAEATRVRGPRRRPVAHSAFDTS